MLPVEGSDLLRIAVLSGLVGFACFCISYGVFVWRRRNSTNGRPSSRATKLAQALVLIGVVGIGLSWTTNEFQGRTGIAGGSDLFVVHSRQESASQQITSADTVKQGDVVAEFLSASDRPVLRRSTCNRLRRGRRSKQSRAKFCNSTRRCWQSRPTCARLCSNSKALRSSCANHDWKSNATARIS
jgi:hypothetical protein